MAKLENIYFGAACIQTPKRHITGLIWDTQKKLLKLCVSEMNKIDL